MKVRWTVYHQGHGGPHYPGDVAELPEHLARELSLAGNAVAVDVEREPHASGGRETQGAGETRAEK